MQWAKYILLFWFHSPFWSYISLKSIFTFKQVYLIFWKNVFQLWHIFHFGFYQARVISEGQVALCPEYQDNFKWLVWFDTFTTTIFAVKKNENRQAKGCREVKGRLTKDNKCTKVRRRKYQKVVKWMSLKNMKQVYNTIVSLVNESVIQKEEELQL